MHSDFIDALGGLKAVHEILGLKSPPAAVWNWRERGVPLKYRHRLAEYAKRHRVELPPDFLKPFEVAA